MDKTLKIELSSSEVLQLQSEFQECVAEMKLANQRMEKSQADIERLKAKTRAMLAELLLPAEA